MDRIIIEPQPGYQEKVLSCKADIVFGGGSAGAGKTFVLLLDPIRGFWTKGFRGIIFRRTTPQITGGGGLWDESMNINAGLGLTPIESKRKWVVPSSGAELQFSHLEYEKDKLNHQGLQYAFIGFDELTHFTQSQFLYLMTRNRSTCGIKPYIRATCNPDPESWVKDWIEWYLDKEGYVIPERDGVIRYFTIDNNNLIWGDTKQEVIDRCPHIPLTEELIKSFTFIEGNLDENKALLQKDPSYKANLMTQDEATRKSLLDRCWKPVQDNLAIVDYNMLAGIFTNFPKEDTKKYISCDVAGFGKDLAVVMTRQGWKGIKTQIFTTSGPDTLKTAIENERQENNIGIKNVVVDNDGMGWGLVDMGYVGFNGGSPAEKDPETAIKENYQNLKTQCWYRMIEQNINTGEISIDLNNMYVDGVLSKEVVVGGKVYEIKKLILDDIKAIKRAKIDKEGKKCINTKEEQKNILGRSPDCGDTMMMRKFLDILNLSKDFWMC